MLSLQLKDMLFEQEHVTFRNVPRIQMALWVQALTKIQLSKHGSFVMKTSCEMFIYQNNHLIFKPIGR